MPMMNHDVPYSDSNSLAVQRCIVYSHPTPLAIVRVHPMTSYINRGFGGCDHRFLQKEAMYKKGSYRFSDHATVRT